MIVNSDRINAAQVQLLHKLNYYSFHQPKMDHHLYFIC
jgi:hypothetical protein